MIKKSLFIAAFITATTASAQWVAPEYSGAFQPLTAGESVYIYNTEAKMFLTEGNDWGTHLSVGGSGLQFTFNQYAIEGEEWDGKSYTIATHSNVKNTDCILFFETGGNIYVDGSTSKSDYLFSLKDLGSNTYQIFGADGNPTFNATGDNAGYLVGRFTGYVNDRDAVETGTGVIFDYAGPDNNFAPGEFQTTWAFVSPADYADYGVKVETYNAAVELGEALTEAEKIGVPNLDAEKSIYANTSSTKEDLQDALEALKKKTLAYYEVIITPDNPVVVDKDDCNAIDAWTNSINASTWNTQTWIGDGWTGFEGTTLNIWGASMNGQVSKEQVDLPNGIYVVSMAVFSEKIEGSVFANENKKSVAGASAGNVYEVTTEVTDGTIKYGFEQETAGENWVAIDNAELKYYGAGVEAYRYWLNGLLESAPKFDEAVAQTSLVEEYNGVLASVNTAKTKEEILAIIPTYEEVLNRVNLNVAAYDALKEAVKSADELSANASINTNYGDKLGDSSASNGEIIENHTLSTEDVQSVTKELQALIDEAQSYIWNVEKFNTEKETAAAIYAEFGSTCSSSAAAAYKEFINKELDFSAYTTADVEALLKELYNIEFNLQVPAEEASDANPIDYTAKISYPSYDSNAEGWTNEGWSTCANNTSWYGFDTVEGALGDQNYLNLWTAGAVCSVSQTLTDLPNGTYVAKVGAYADAQGFQLFANDDYVDVEVGQTGNGERGQWYEIVTVVTDGTLKLGARNTVEAENWCMIDNWSLSYCGTNSEKEPTAVTQIIDTTSSASSIFTVTGVRSNTLSKGINVVKMSDGSVRKVLVK